MRRFIVLVSLLSSTSLFAQWEQPQNRLDKLQMAANPVIVEFRDPPLCERRAIAAKAAKAEYEAMFRRFRSDISSSNVTYEYYELFNGVALTASADRRRLDETVLSSARIADVESTHACATR